MWRVKLGRAWDRVPWACLLWLAPAVALSALLAAGYFGPSGRQINQFPPTPSRWYAVVQRGVVQVYHFGATVPESSVPQFARLKRSSGTWAQGALVLGEARHARLPEWSVQGGYVHQGGLSRSATPFTFWTVSVWTPFFLSWLLFLPAAAAFRRHRSQLRRGAGLCTGCGYDLTGNVSGVCPECGGARFELQAKSKIVASASPPAQPPDGPVAGAVRGGGGAVAAELLGER